jgi:tetratricopeptide (TPR) repeat protein
MALLIGIVFFALLGSVACAGDFSCSWAGSKDKINLNIPRPPDALIRAKNIRIQWESPGNLQQRAAQLQQLIQEALRKEYGFSDRDYDATMKLSVLGYEPVRERRYTQTETVRMKVGERTVYDKNGKPRQEDVFADRQVPVQYWEAQGFVSVSVVVDEQGNSIDSFTPSARRSLKERVAVNGESTLGGTRILPSAELLETQMLSEIAHEVRRRYTATFDTQEVILACDDELKPGNKLAKVGQFAPALAAWEAAKMKKNPGDRLFNMAAAKEALAYAEYSQSQNLEDMLPLFKEAMDLYEQALKMDPEEKYMRQQVSRINLAKKNIDRVRQQYEVQQEIARQAAAKAEEALKQKMAEDLRNQQREAACKDTAPDSAEEARFRPIARIRLSALQDDITGQQVQDEVAFGQRTFGLDEFKSYRVVCQEVARKKSLAQKLKDYEDVFAAFVTDGRLTAAERSQAKDLQKALGLEDSEVKPVESKYQFKEGVQVAMPRAPTAPSKPTADAKKSTVPPVSPSPTAPTKPEPVKPGIGTVSKPKN